ncbi:MAG: TetR/AcrR family transcriptional regulator [Anaerolineae bacterium]|jgi:AcrR family transcriptional regulator|nr:TetR/AcrR family transcriptional regulator [Anaerolineae bacterium]
MTEITRKPDRRIERTRQLLRDALMDLIVQRGYESVTVQDITDHANVARTTFYLHFRDKDDLLFSTMRDIYQDLMVRMSAARPETIMGIRIDLHSTADFEHVQQYADFYKIMLSEKGSMVFLMRVQALLAEMCRDQILAPMLANGGHLTLPIDLAASHLAWAMIGTFHWWLQTGMTYSASDMAKMELELCAGELPNLLQQVPLE